MNKKLLYIGRHKLTEEQLMELGFPEIIQYKEALKRVEDVKELISKADMILSSLPINMQSDILDLAGENKPVLYTKTKRVFNDEGFKMEFIYDRTVRYTKIDVREEDFCVNNTVD